MDLRLRVVAAVHGGMSCQAAADHYQVSESSAMRWVRRARQTGSAAALPMGGKRPFVLAKEKAWLVSRLSEKPDLTLRALLAELAERGITVSYYALWNILDRAGFSVKKKPARQRTGSTGRRPATAAVASPPGQG
jgi:transposase